MKNQKSTGFVANYKLIKMLKFATCGALELFVLQIGTEQPTLTNKGDFEGTFTVVFELGIRITIVFHLHF